LVPFVLNEGERKMVNNLINAAYLGKNMYFSSVTRIQSPKGRGGDENNISIMKRRLDTRINDGYQQSPRLGGPGENQKNFIKVAHILSNGQVCFANEKLPRQLPNDMVYARRFIDIINTYIMFLNHKYQNRNMSFRYL